MRVGDLPLFHLFGDQIDPLPDLRFDLCEVLLLHRPFLHEQTLESREGVPLQVFGELIRITVLLLVVRGGMGQEAHGVRFNHAGPCAVTGSGNGIGRRFIRCTEVAAVHLVPVQPFVSLYHAEDRFARELLGNRDGDGKLVVLDEKDHREPAPRGPVDRLVKFPLTRRPFARGNVHDFPPSFTHGTHRCPEGLQVLGPRRAGLCHDPVRHMAVVKRHRKTVAARPALPVKGLQEDLFDGISELKGEREITVVRVGPVHSRLQRHARGGLRHFVSGTHRCERTPSPASAGRGSWHRSGARRQHSYTRRSAVSWKDPR